jgi:hypothetical protein
MEYPPNTLSRSLNLEDIQTTLCVLGGGLIIASISIFIECYKSSISFVCFIITGLVNMFSGLVWVLQGIRKWLMHLNQL